MNTPTPTRTIASPEIWPDNKEFWAGTNAGKLLVKHCSACNKPHWYPRPQCPFCMSDKTVWKESAGTGTIYTFSVSRRVGPVPYVIAYVRLDDGVTMMSNIVDCDLEAIRIGDRVKVAMKPSADGTMVPMFTPL
jgi:hypothetical protein